MEVTVAAEEIAMDTEEAMVVVAVTMEAAAMVVITEVVVMGIAAMVAAATEAAVMVEAVMEEATAVAMEDTVPEAMEEVEGVNTTIQVRSLKSPNGMSIP